MTADYITTYQKIHFTPTKPVKEEISLRDIAHALSLLCRANGHFPHFYSVGQHCLNCAAEAKARGEGEAVVLACLLHDASEAYLADVTRPVKKYLPQYCKIEEGLQKLLYETYLGRSLTVEEKRRIQIIDDDLLYYEFQTLMGEEVGKPTQPMEGELDFSQRDFGEVEREYLETVEKLVRNQPTIKTGAAF